MSHWPLGVFVSFDAGLGAPLEVAHELGVATAHIHAPSRVRRSAESAAALRRRLDELGVKPTVVFAGFDGESYADIPTVSCTVGLAPVETREARTSELLEIAHFADALGVRAVGLHLGFIPHDAHAADFAGLVAVMQRVCDDLKSRGQAIHLETGQEPAAVLLDFLRITARDNLFVNFDPANMILYGVGQPLETLAQLGGHVRSVHAKDATWSDQPGVTWGVETPLGAGHVDFPAFVSTLEKIGYRGPITIEREIPHEPARQRAEIAAAVSTLKSLMN